LFHLASTSTVALWITILCLMFCALTDVVYRRVSEVVILICLVAVLILHFSVLSVIFAVLCALLWIFSSLRGVAWGDVEMAALVGLGFGPLSFLVLLAACVLALLSQPLWPRLSTQHTPVSERHLAPMGLYFALGALVTLLIAPEMLSALSNAAGLSMRNA
jgi:hypothetical protein